MTPGLLAGLEDEAYQQLVQTSRQPGIVRALLMPDGHVGYGCPVGTVAIAQDWIYPMMAGYDIGCFTAETLIPTVDGFSYPIGDLAKSNQSLLVYALNAERRVVVAEATARRTRIDAPLVRVTLDNGRHVDCTPDHEFMLRDGSYCQAQSLMPSTSLMPFSVQGEIVPGGGFGIHNHRRRVQRDNHKVVRVEHLPDTADVYCLTVPRFGNFALDAGIFVHNCGMQIITSSLTSGSLTARDIQELMSDISRRVAMGTGQGFGLLSPTELTRYLDGGIPAMVKDGYATDDDVWRTEEPCLQPTGAACVSQKAFERGVKTAGSLGGGNHFLEGQRIRVIDEDLCERWGLWNGQFVFQIHCGSRGLGHQVGTDYLAIAAGYMKANGIPIAHRELVGLPLDSSEGQAYLAAMYTAANFSTVNRQLIMHHLREGFRRVLEASYEDSDLRLGLLYNTPHNVTRAERLVDGSIGIVHRKGATRACPAGHERTPQAYKETGHPVLIPGAMGRPSYILVGLAGGAVTECSVNHGAGRSMSRAQAKKKLTAGEVTTALGKVKINHPVRHVVDEAPQAYKDIDLIIAAVETAGLARVVAKLEPLFCMKGTN